MDIRILLLPIAVLLVAVCVALFSTQTAPRIMGWLAATLAGFHILLLLTAL